MADAHRPAERRPLVVLLHCPDDLLGRLRRDRDTEALVAGPIGVLVRFVDGAFQCLALLVLLAGDVLQVLLVRNHLSTPS